MGLLREQTKREEDYGYMLGVYAKIKGLVEEEEMMKESKKEKPQE